MSPRFLYHPLIIPLLHFTLPPPLSLSIYIYVVCISTYTVVFAVVIVVVLSVYLSVRPHENNTNDGFCSC